MAGFPGGGGPGGRYGYAELEQLWISAGGPERLASIMAAIALAESGGNPRAYNPSGASGLWQILGNPYPGQDPFDPHQNARMAVWKWKHQGLKAWVTYTSGAYKQYLRRGIPPASGGLPQSYRNPFRDVRGLRPERIDMGVDYAGTGPVFALGPGKITAVSRAWAGGVGAVGPGTWITEELTAGPLKGRQVYLAENVIPQVRSGQRVTAGTVLGTMTGGIETGFAAPGVAGQRGETAATAAGQDARSRGTSSDPGAFPTAYGAAYSGVLHAAGAPAGVGGGKPVGVLDSALSGILKALGIVGGFLTGGIGTAGTAVLDALGLGNLQRIVSDAVTAVDWLVNPSNWIRILAGAGGGVLVISGVFVLSHAGGSVSTPVGSVSARPSALPIGILMVGSGGILLFIAFHNLPPEVKNVTDLAGWARDQAQAATAGQKATLV